MIIYIFQSNNEGRLLRAAFIVCLKDEYRMMSSAEIVVHDAFGLYAETVEHTDNGF